MSQSAPSTKDLAEFARLGLHLDLLKHSAVVEWADELIREGDVPPVWLIDVSLSDSESVDRTLSKAPGVFDEQLPIRMIHALVRHRWSSGSFTISGIRRLGWRVYIETSSLTSESQPHWGLVLEVEGEEFDNEWWSEEDRRRSIEEKLAPYAEFEKLLPNWALQKEVCARQFVINPHPRPRTGQYAPGTLRSTWFSRAV